MSPYFYTWCGPSANLECKSEICIARGLAGNGRKKSPFWHHCTTLSGYIFGTKACIDNRKKLLNSNTSSTCPVNMLNFRLLTAEICLRVWGTPANFNGFRVLASLLHSTLVVGVSQSLRHWTDGATYIRQGGHHVGHWPTFLVFFLLFHYCTVCCATSYGEIRFSKVFSSILCTTPQNLADARCWSAVQ